VQRLYHPLSHPGARHPRCGGVWRGPFHADSGPVQVCNACGEEQTMPNQPKTPARSVRIPDELWQAVQVKASETGETATDVITRALRRYVKR
jgi:hypothetical protein